MMIRESEVPSHATAPEMMKIPLKPRSKLLEIIEFTFKAAADGSSGSFLNGLVFSELRFLQCLDLTSPILNTCGAPVDENIP